MAVIPSILELAREARALLSGITEPAQEITEDMIEAAREELEEIGRLVWGGD